MDTTLARWRIPALIAALTALVVAAVYALSPAGRGAAPGAAASNAATSGSTSPAASIPPKLVFQGGLGGSRSAPAPMAAEAGVAADSKMAGPRGAYVLEGTLGTGPQSSAVYKLSSPTADQVARLATALGLPAPKRTADGWEASDSKHQLIVQSGAGGNWWYGMAPDCGPMPADAAEGKGEGTSSYGCSVSAPDAPVAVPACGDAATTCLADDSKDYVEPKTADDATVRKAAAAILAAAGVQLEGARVALQYGSISVDPLVRELPTSGVQTSVSVDAEGNVQWANGWLGALVEGDTYPLITAAEAFKQLQNQPMMGIMQCLPVESASDVAKPSPAATNGGIVPPDKTASAASKGKPAADVAPDAELVDPAIDPMIEGPQCGQFTPEPIVVTGATFGLSAQWLENNTVVLAPSWLFAMKGSELWPMPILAIDPSFLGLPAPEEVGSVKPMPAEVGPASSSPANVGTGETCPAGAKERKAYETKYGVDCGGAAVESSGGPATPTTCCTQTASPATARTVKCNPIDASNDNEEICVTPN